MLFKNLSIKVKIILIIQLVSLFSLLIGFSYVIYSNVANFKEDMKNNAIINATLIGDYCAVPLAFDVSEYANETLEKLQNIPSADIGIVYNDKNKVFAEFYRGDEKEIIAHPEYTKTWSKFEGEHLHLLQDIYYEGELAGKIYLKLSTNELSSKIRNYLITMLILLIVLLFVNYMLAIGLQRFLSEPILKLTKATKEISREGNYQLRVQKHGNDEIGILVDEYNKMLNQIYEREEALKLRTSELTSTLEDLKQTQQKLINSEKLAALGQLIAGVAHEINTPLGAIRSSIGNLRNSLNFLVKEYPDFINQLSDNSKALFYKLTEDSLSNQHMLTSKEERQFKKQLTATFEEYNIDNAYSFADTFVDLKVVDGIDNYIDLLRKDDAEEVVNMAYRLTGLHRSTENIEFAADRASKVVFALKNSSRIGNSNELSHSDITVGIETVLTLYNNQIKQGIEVIKHYEKIPKIDCYFDELNQVWTNILHNAIYAMELSGVLQIATYTENDDVVVAITDSGKGIPADEIDQIFNPFFTTKPAGEGTGIGLDIVKRIVTKHKGRITVESQPGKTTFRVFIPINYNNNEE